MTRVIVCPGGAYRMHSMDHEGHQVVRWLQEQGVSASILQYRFHYPDALDDLKAAIRSARPGRVGVMGFSAGGHLASMGATMLEGDRRPDFAVLVYPVIALAGPYAHQESARNLGGDPEYLSTHYRVTKNTCPSFLVHTAEDAAVPPHNSVMFYEALLKAGVPAELHIYEKGAHGIGLREDWTSQLARWLRETDLRQQ
jgi:acetyl esterase/lipase